MGLIGSNSDFSELQVLLCHLWEKEREDNKMEKGRKEKAIEKEWKEQKKIGGKEEDGILTTI